MKDSLHTLWRWVRWPLVIVVGAYIVFVIWDAFRLNDIDKTNAAVAAIHAQHITLADVTGDVQIKYPIDQAANDATVAGIDSNKNGIRDDVEVAIFKKYLNDKKARGAALQYAMTEQMYLTKVYNTETWKAVAEEVGRAGLCVLHTKANWQQIDSWIFDTQSRKDSQENAFKFITSHGDAPGTACDVSL